MGIEQEKYLYFRAQTTDADDDAATDSACFPVSSFMGMQPGSDTVLTLFFKNMVRGSGNSGFDMGETTVANVENYDYVQLVIPANTHIVAMKAIAKAIAGGSRSEPFIVIANNDSGGTEYLAGSGITSCFRIVQEVAFTYSAGICCTEG